MSDAVQADGLSTSPCDPDQPYAVPGDDLADPAAGDQVAVSQRPAREIATLPPLDEAAPGIPISPSTGQPRRSVVMVGADVLLYAASLVAAGALAWSWWQAIHMATFAESSELVRRWQPRPGGWRSIVAVTLVCAIGASMVAAPAIAALNAWNGHRWSRVAALVAAAIGCLGWFIGPLAWPVPVLCLLAAAVLWTPPVGRYFEHWRVFRAGEPVPVAPQHPVVYGPVPRHR